MLKVHVGDGYRQVLPNEPLKDGDQYWDAAMDHWCISYNAKGNRQPSPGLFYRRKVETSAPVSRPAETYRTASTAPSFQQIPKASCSGYATFKASASVKAGEFVKADGSTSSPVCVPGGDPIKFGVLHNYSPVSHGFHWGNAWNDETTVFAATSKDGYAWTYIYNRISGRPVVRTTFDAKLLPIGTYVRFDSDGKCYRPLTQHDNPKDYRNFWIKENGTNEVERITWHDKTGVNGETFENLFQNYSFEGGSPVGATI